MAVSNETLMLEEEYIAPAKEKVISPEQVPEDFRIAPSVCKEVQELSEIGLDVALVDVYDFQAPGYEDQQRIDAKIEELEEAPNGDELFRANETMAVWDKLKMRATSLTPIYNGPGAATLGEGISSEAYDTPIFPEYTVNKDGESVMAGMMSAKEVLLEDKKNKPEKALKIIGDYEKFLQIPIDGEAKDFFWGTMDARGVRTRAHEAVSLTKQHFEERGGLQGRELTSASLACGAAGPVYELANDVQAAGASFEKIILVDQDPMALAGAHSLAESAGVSEKIDIQKRDLLVGELTDYIEPHSVDVVDLLGLFEYIPNYQDREGWDLAAQLLKKTKDIVKPGGIIVFGNMLQDRPQQKNFSEVVKWPRLYQRTVEDTLGIIDQAGFDVSKVKTRIPAREGVYAVYAIPVDELEPQSSQDQDALEEMPLAS